MADDTSNTKAKEASPKLDVIEFVEKNTNRSAAGVFEIEEKLVQEWRAQKDELQKLPPEPSPPPALSPPAPPAPQTPANKRTPKRSFTPAFKLQVIKRAEENTNRSAAKEFNIDDKMVREWRKQKERLEALPPEKLERKMGNSGLRPLLPDLEKTLVEWIRTQPKRPTNVQIQAKALELNANEVADFKASRGWLDKFMHRHSLHAHRLSSSGGIPTASPVMTMDVDSVISQIIPSESEAIDIQACLDVVNTEETATKRRKYAPAYKLMVIEHAEKTSNREAAREFSVDERMVRGWRGQKEHLQSLPQDDSQPLIEPPLEVPTTPMNVVSPDVSVVSTPGQSTPNKKRKYDVAFKLKAVEYAEKVSNRGAGRHFNVDEKRVREWRKQKELLATLPPGKVRVGKSGCHPLLPELEKMLVSWINESPVKPTHSKIQAKALELHTGEKPFKASRGWLEKFLNRHKVDNNDETSSVEMSTVAAAEAAEPSVVPDVIQITQEDLSEVDIQACLNLARTIQDSVKQGAGDENALMIAKSIEETVKKSIAESLAKNAQRNIDLDPSQIQSIAETLMETVGETVARTLEAAQVESIAQTLAETIHASQVQSIADGMTETVEESIAAEEMTIEEMSIDENVA